MWRSAGLLGIGGPWFGKAVLVGRFVSLMVDKDEPGKIACRRRAICTHDRVQGEARRDAGNQQILMIGWAGI